VKTTESTTPKTKPAPPDTAEANIHRDRLDAYTRAVAPAVITISGPGRREAIAREVVDLAQAIMGEVDRRLAADASAAGPKSEARITP